VEGFYLEIQKYIYKADDATKNIIRQHLMTISTVLKPSEEKLKVLKDMEMVPFASEEIANLEEFGIETDSNEGKFLAGIMSDVSSTMGDGSVADPTSAIFKLFQSGTLMKSISNLQRGVSSNQLDMRKLMGVAQTAFGKLGEDIDKYAPESEPVE
jgi:hypothetical protein